MVPVVEQFLQKSAIGSCMSELAYLELQKAEFQKSIRFPPLYPPIVVTRQYTQTFTLLSSAEEALRKVVTSYCDLNSDEKPNALQRISDIKTLVCQIEGLFS